MRKQIVAGNWKMNTTVAEGQKLATAVVNNLAAKPSQTLVIVAAPFTHLSTIKQTVADSPVLLAAQNCAAETSGAYTGEISATMLADLGVDAVILGHSERRAYYGDTDEQLIKKLGQTMANNMMPIFCCGELLDQRKDGSYFDVVKAQIEAVLWNLTAEEFAKVVIAYEPVWAIGTGEVATAAQAQEMHAYIRSLIVSKYGEKVAADTSILYGGSCKPSNAQELFANTDVDGGLIGGASLADTDFTAIARSF